MTSYPVPPTSAPAAQATPRAAMAQPLAPVVPVLGSRAVTAAVHGQAMRLDPGPPADPAPLKGLGIPPLNTRQVGDFDKLDEPRPPMGVALGDRLADLESLPATGLDLRR